MSEGSLLDFRGSLESGDAAAASSPALPPIPEPAAGGIPAARPKRRPKPKPVPKRLPPPPEPTRAQVVQAKVTKAAVAAAAKASTAAKEVASDIARATKPARAEAAKNALRLLPTAIVYVDEREADDYSRSSPQKTSGSTGPRPRTHR